MTIRLLPEDIIARVRAAEFVRRPANIVKELVENSIDAGSDCIHIDIASGGKKSIRVIDNGDGIHHDQLTLAVEPHATSKLSRENMDSIATLGFRGEGLASIGAVCNLKITSRRMQDECAWSISVDFGTVSEYLPSQGAKGTTVCALNMFSNHPARYKDLNSQSNRAEANAVKQTVEDLALSHPSVKFVLSRDNKPWLTFASENWKERIISVIGKEFVDNSADMEFKSENFSIRGFIGLPTWRAHSTVSQRFFVNLRPVREKSFANALKKAFRDLAPNIVPAAVIYLDIKPELIDVNVHPEKSQIMLRNLEEVSNSLVSAIRQSIGSAGSLAAQSLSDLAAAAALHTNVEDAQSFPLGEAIGVIGGRYAIGVVGKDMVLVDVHAASERVVYEELKQYVTSNGVPISRIEPIPVKVGEWNASLLAARQDSLLKFGLEFSFEEEWISILGIPSFIPNQSARELVMEIVSCLADDPFCDPLQNKIEKYCALIACHNSIRSGDKMDLATLNRLFRKLEATPEGAQCMHGRPIAVGWTGEQLDGLFGR